MSYDAIMHKLSSAELTLSPQMQDVIQRVRETGLHKVAAPLYGVDELTLKTAVQQLSTSLLAQHYKYQKIASGLESYAVLNGEKTAGLKEIWGALTRPLGKAPAAAEAVGADLAEQLAPTGYGISKGTAVSEYGTGGLLGRNARGHTASGLTVPQERGHAVAGPLLASKGDLVRGQEVTGLGRISYPAAPPMPPAMVGSAAGSAAAKTLTSVPQFSGSKRILPAKPGQLT